jgi:hypothetical protein
MEIAVHAEKRTDHLLNKFGLQMYCLEQRGDVPSDGRHTERAKVNTRLFRSIETTRPKQEPWGPRNGRATTRIIAAVQFGRRSALRACACPAADRPKAIGKPAAGGDRLDTLGRSGAHELEVPRVWWLANACLKTL